MADHPKLREALEKFSAGLEVNFNGIEVPAAMLSEKIRSAAHNTETIVLSIRNAKIVGDINLNGIGQSDAPITLQIIGCRILGGLRSRGSHWRMLLIAKTKMQFLELPKAQLRDLLIEASSIEGTLEARSIEVIGNLSLSGSSFGADEGGISIQLKEARVGHSLGASNVVCAGTFAAAGARIDGELDLSGSTLGRIQDDAVSHALDLAGTSISGPLNICATEGRRFTANGPVHLVNAKLGTLAALGAKLNGDGLPSIIADGAEITASVLLGQNERFVFEASGTVRFMLAKVGGQFQFAQGKLSSPERRCLALDSSKVNGDVLLGHSESNLTINGSLSADNFECGGRVIIWNVSADATGSEDGSAISLRGAKISGALKIYNTKIRGCLNIDRIFAGDVNILEFQAARYNSISDLSTLPENYAHENEALISGIYATISADLYCDDIKLNGGDFRMIGASVGGLFRMSKATIDPRSRLAFIMQDANIAGGIMFAGTKTKPLQFSGGVSFMGAKFGASMNIIDAVITSPENDAELSLDNCKFENDALLHRVNIRGRCGFGSANVQGNLRFEATIFDRNGRTALYANGANISGQLSFSSDHPEREDACNCHLNGDAFLDGLRAGSIRWTNLELAESANFYATGMIIDRSLEALGLISAGGARLSLDGSRTASLLDNVGDERDGWGAGKAALDLSSFRYERLIVPSGKNRNLPEDIRYWRRKWLDRRSDRSSTQAARQLARILHEQGLHEGSRVILMDAFSEEGRNASTRGLQLLHLAFGALFGHGFSGGRAFLTIICYWMIGTLGIMYLQSTSLLIEDDKGKPTACFSVDPSLYAADLLLPVIELGQEDKCKIAPPAVKREINNKASNAHVFGHNYILFENNTVAGYALACFRLAGWILFSIALATWSGLFKRSGRAPS